MLLPHVHECSFSTVLEQKQRGERDQVCCRACTRQTQYFTPNHPYKARFWCLKSQRASLITTLKTFNRSQRVQLGAMNSQSTQEPNQQFVQMISCTSPPLLQTLGSKEEGINSSLYLCYSENVGKSPCTCRVSSCKVCVWLKKNKTNHPNKQRAIINLFIISFVELFCFSWKSSSLLKGVNIYSVNHRPT